MFNSSEGMAWRLNRLNSRYLNYEACIFGTMRGLDDKENRSDHIKIQVSKEPFVLSKPFGDIIKQYNDNRQTISPNIHISLNDTNENIIYEKQRILSA